MFQPGVGSANWRSEFVENAVTESPYHPVMRFTLADREDRIFTVRRQTCRGEGGWSWALEDGPLPGLADEYLPHIGHESFCELI